MGKVPHEEYVPTGKELHLLRAQSPLVYDTFWELMYHVHICGQMIKLRNQASNKKHVLSICFRTWVLMVMIFRLLQLVLS